jgi:peptide/nickel transport system substrate-binding protein
MPTAKLPQRAYMYKNGVYHHSSQGIMPAMNANHKPAASSRIRFVEACVVLGCLWGAVPPVHAANPVPKPFVIAVSNAPKTLDPMLGADAAAARLLQLTHPALLQFNAAYQPVGLVAAGCAQPNPTRVTCTIPPRTFTDGTPITAAAVATWLKAVQANKLSPLAGLLASTSLSVPASNTVAFQLAEPSLGFMANLTQIPLANPANPTVGAGPYVMAEKDTLGAVTVRTKVQGYAPALTFLPLTDATTRLLKLKKGEVDAVYNDLPADAATWAKANGLSVQAEPGLTYAYVGLNFANRDLANPAVRQALGLALDRPAIRRALLGGLAAPADTLLPPSHPAAWKAPEETFDPFTAEGLLDEAILLPDGEGTRLTLTLLTSTEPQSQRISQAIQAYWAKIGVKVVLRPTEWASFFAQVQKGDFDAVLLAWTGEIMPDMYYQMFNSRQMPPVGLNRGRVKDARVDALTQAIHTANTPEAQNAAAVQLQKTLADLHAVVPLYRKYNVLLARPGVTGCKLTAAGYYTGFATCRAGVGKK